MNRFNRRASHFGDIMTLYPVAHIYSQKDENTYSSRAEAFYPEAVSWLLQNSELDNNDFFTCFSEIVNAVKPDMGGRCRVYDRIGISRCDICRWKNDFCSGSFEKKRRTVLKMREILHITDEQMINLLAKTGLVPMRSNNEKTLSVTANKKLLDISDKMYYHIKNGRHITKHSLVCIALYEKTSVSAVQEYLYRYGYCLSSSLLDDAVILEKIKRGETNVSEINTLLYDLKLPLIGTRLYKN
jgi:hypothetical protein